MASPQKEHGFTPIAHEILEALARTPLNGYEARYLFALWRKTYGYNKKCDRISNSQFVAITSLRKGHITRTQQRLIQRNIVTKNGNSLEFNKDYDGWLDRDGVTKIGITVTKIGNKKLPKMEDTKEKKDIIQNKLPAKAGKHMKKNQFAYAENQHSDFGEDVIDLDTGEAVEEAPKSDRGADMKALIQFAEKKRGKPCMNYGKQRKCIATMFDNGITAWQIGERWLEMMDEAHWQKTGFDFKNVLDSFDRKPLPTP